MLDPKFVAELMISIHAPRAGRDEPRHIREGRSKDFNPRAPCGARRREQWQILRSTKFQSTRPVRGATAIPTPEYFRELISIHAPRAGRDSDAWRSCRDSFLFQSTRPVRGATQGYKAALCYGWISIHAPRAGRDLRRAADLRFQLYFNPRAPCGARLSTLTGWITS